MSLILYGAEIVPFSKAQDSKLPLFYRLILPVFHGTEKEQDKIYEYPDTCHRDKNET
jgi:hypothetical protein